MQEPPTEAPGLPGGWRLPTATAIVLAVALSISFAVKLPCARGPIAIGVPRLCYSDIPVVYVAKDLRAHPLPYVDVPIEYPVLTGVAMWLAAIPARSPMTFLVLNALGLAAAAVVTVVLLNRLVGVLALYVALAPTFVLNAFLNWDLLPVALSTAAVYAFLRRRPGWSGVFAGLGVAAKLYPILLVPPFVVDLWRRREDRSGVSWFLAGTAISWVAANAAFMLATPSGWALFYTFSSERWVDALALAVVPCRILGKPSCGGGHIQLVNTALFVAFAALSAAVWFAKARTEPGFRRWTLVFPLLIAFLLTSKVYSPQYSLWLLPWFALVLPDLRLFIAFEAADVAVFLTTFSRSVPEGGGWPDTPALVAVVIRAIVLLACLIVYVRRRRLGADAEAGAAPGILADQRSTGGLGT